MIPSGDALAEVLRGDEGEDWGGSFRCLFFNDKGKFGERGKANKQTNHFFFVDAVWGAKSSTRAFLLLPLLLTYYCCCLRRKVAHKGLSASAASFLSHKGKEKEREKRFLVPMKFRSSGGQILFSRKRGGPT